MNIRTYNSVPCAFACEELIAYAKKIFCDLDTVDTDFYIGLPENGETIVDSEIDEIYIDVTGGKGKIVGSNDGAVVIATYRFLRECGCRFLRPGKDGEYLPKTTLADQRVCLKERADSEIRATISEGAISHENFYEIIDFLPKVGLNHYQFQFKNSYRFFKMWYSHYGNPLREEEPYCEDDLNAEFPKMCEAIALRGLHLETMGHGWTAYPFGLTGNGWDMVACEIPEEINQLYAQINGKRGVRGGNNPMDSQLCYSNPVVRERITDYLVEYCRENPQVDIIHFALADGVDNACECEECKKKRLSDWVVMMLNLADEKMTAAGLSQRIAMSLYIDLIWPPQVERIKNHDRILLTFWPISRVYHDPLPALEDVPETEALPYVVNHYVFTEDCTDYLTFYRAWRKVEPNAKFFLGDYYYMWDHYLDIGYQKIARILHTDIQNHENLGFSGMFMYQFNRNSFPTGIGIYTYGHTLWNHKTDFDALSRDYYRHAFGDGWEDALSYMEALSTRFDMIIKPGTRKYPVKDCVPVIEDCIAMVRKFRAKYDSKRTENETQDRSWQDLAIHNRYVEWYLSAFLLGFSGKEAEGREQVEALCRWLWSMEDEVQLRWDLSVHAKHLLVWYDRLMEIKQTEEKGEKANKKSGTMTEFGIQA